MEKTFIGSKLSGEKGKFAIKRKTFAQISEKARNLQIYEAF